MREGSHSHVPTSFLEVTADPGGRLEEANFAETSGVFCFLFFLPPETPGAGSRFPRRGVGVVCALSVDFRQGFPPVGSFFVLFQYSFFISYRGGSTKSHPNRFLD